MYRTVKGEQMAIGVGMNTPREEIEQRIEEARFGMEGGVTIKLGEKEWRKQETVRQKDIGKGEIVQYQNGNEEGQISEDRASSYTIMIRVRWGGVTERRG